MQLMAELLNTFYSRAIPLYGIIEDLETGKLVCSCGNPNCPEKSWGKHPKIKWLDYQYDPSDGLFKEANVGIRMGYCDNDKENYIAIDVDFGTLFPRPNTLTIRTSLQEDGIWKEQFIFKAKHVYKGETKISHPCGCKFDIRSYNNYIVGAGSKHRSGTTYTIVNDAEIAELTPELEEIIKPYIKKATFDLPAHIDIISDECAYSPELAAQMLGKIKLEMLNPEKPDDYNSWLYASIAAQRANVSFAAWLAWCKREPGYNAKEPDSHYLHKWESFKTWNERPITHKTFWNNYCTCTIDEEIIQNVIEFVFKKEDKKEQFFDSTRLPKIMQSFMQFVKSKIQYTTDKSELAAALALMSGVTMHGYRSATGTPLSLYILLSNTAGTSKSSAKNVVQSTLRDVYAQCGMLDKDRFIGKIQSRQALQARLLDSPYRISLSDEFIQTMRGVLKDPDKEINSDRVSALLTCFDGEYLEASETKTLENTLAAVENPILTILGCGTRSVLEQMASYPAFKETGFASRCLLFDEKSEILNEEFDHDSYTKKYESIKELVNICKVPKKITISDTSFPDKITYEPIKLEWENLEAKKLFAEIDMTKRRDIIADKSMPSFYKEFLSRHGNKVSRISALIAIANGHLKVSVDDLLVAHDLVEYTHLDMFEYLKYETLQEKLEEKITNAYKYLLMKNKIEPNIRDLQRKIGSRDLPNGAAQLRSICAALDLSIKPTKVRNMPAKG